MKTTFFTLMACYQKALVPLETVGADFLGLGKKEVNEQATRNKRPFPALRLSHSSKAPRFVRIEDLAEWIDHQAAAARQSRQQSQL